MRVAPIARMANDSDGPSGEGVTTRELTHRIIEDVRTIVRLELELVRGEVGRVAKLAAIEAAVAVFGGTFAVIGLALLCLAAVVALAPVLSSLALRLVVVGVVFGAIGGALAAIFGIRLRRDVVPDLAVPIHEARSTVEGVKATLQERGSQVHA